VAGNYSGLVSGRNVHACSQGDQTSLLKIAQNVVKIILSQNYRVSFTGEKRRPKIWATFVFFKKQTAQKKIIAA
jgi:hypothetical protein